MEHPGPFILEKHRLEHGDFPVIVTESPVKEPVDRQKTLEVRASLGAACPSRDGPDTVFGSQRGAGAPPSEAFTL